MSENKVAALSEPKPGDTALVSHRGSYETATITAIHQDSQGEQFFQVADGRVLPKARLLGQLGTTITVHEELDENAPDYAPGRARDHLEMPVVARLFGLPLTENPGGYTTPCPFCATEILALNRRRGMWLFDCACGKRGDLMDLVGGLTQGADWQPDAMSFDEMSDIVLGAIGERIKDERDP